MEGVFGRVLKMWVGISFLNSGALIFAGIFSSKFLSVCNKDREWIILARKTTYLDDINTHNLVAAVYFHKAYIRIYVMFFVYKYRYLYIKFIPNIIIFYIIGLFKKSTWKTYKLRKIDKLMKYACFKLMVSFFFLILSSSGFRDSQIFLQCAVYGRSFVYILLDFFPSCPFFLNFS